jgi:hypothetical protein
VLLKGDEERLKAYALELDHLMVEYPVIILSQTYLNCMDSPPKKSLLDDIFVKFENYELFNVTAFGLEDDLFFKTKPGKDYDEMLEDE